MRRNEFAPIRVVHFEDDENTRSSVKEFLERDGRFLVIAAAANWQNALEW